MFGKILTLSVTALLQSSSQDAFEKCAPANFDRHVVVDSTPELVRALANLRPGDFVDIQPGTYSGQFKIEGVRGNSSKRAYVCARDTVRLKPSSRYRLYGLHVADSSSVLIGNLDISEFDKGVMLDRSRGVVLQHLSVHHIRQEGVHFRDGSVYNVLRDSYIRRTGLGGRNSSGVDVGEGVYVGSAHGTRRIPQPDKSDSNKIIDNRISHTTAEGIDIKEGTSKTVVRGNRINGAGMRIDNRYADTLIDIKGSNCSVTGNKLSLGYLNGERIQSHAIEVHEVGDDSVENAGRNNRFSLNEVYGDKASDTEGGFIVRISGSGQRGNVVACNNKSNLASMQVSNRGRGCDRAR